MSGSCLLDLLGRLHGIKLGLVGVVQCQLNSVEQPATGRQLSGREREPAPLVGGKELWQRRWLTEEQRVDHSQRHRTDGRDAGQISGLAFFGSWVPALRQEWP